MNSGSNATRINKPPVWIVISQEQGPEPWASAFGIGPAAHHEFLAVQAFGLAPQVAIAGRVGCIGAFGDDALERHCAGLFKECTAAPKLVIV